MTLGYYQSLKVQLFLIKKNSLVEFGKIYFRRHVVFLEQTRKSRGIPPQITSLNQFKASYKQFYQQSTIIGTKNVHSLKILLARKLLSQGSAAWKAQVGKHTFARS